MEQYDFEFYDGELLDEQPAADDSDAHAALVLKELTFSIQRKGGGFVTTRNDTS